MEFSYKVTKLAKDFAVEPKDVLFAMLLNSGASVAEAYAVIYRPNITTNNSLTTKARATIAEKPNFDRLIEKLRGSTATATPVKQKSTLMKRQSEIAEQKNKMLQKDTLLLEYAEIALNAQKDEVKMKAMDSISNLMRMKNEEVIEQDKRITFYIPLDYKNCDRLFEYLEQYYSDDRVSDLSDNNKQV